MWELLHFMVSLGKKGGIRAMFMGFIKFIMLCVFGFFSLIMVLAYISSL